MSNASSGQGPISPTVINTFGDANSAIGNGVGHVLDASDWVFTWLRLGQVFAAVMHNDGSVANDADVPETPFNKVVHTPDGGLTPLGWTFAGTMGVGLFGGIGRAIYREHRKLRVKSYDYLMQRMREVRRKDLRNRNSTSSYNLHGVSDGMDYINWSKANLLHKINPEGNYRANMDEESKYFSFSRVKAYEPFKANTAADEQDKKKYEVNPFFKAVNWLSSTSVANFCSYIWNYSSNHAFLFWIVWMPFSLALGATAAALMPVMPVIIGLTIGIGSIFTIWKCVDMWKSYSKDQAEIKNIAKVLLHKDNEIDSSDPNFAQSIRNIIGQLQCESREFNNLKIGDIKKAKLILEAYREHQQADAQEQSRITKELRQRVFMKYEHRELEALIKSRRDTWYLDEVSNNDANRSRLIAVRKLNAARLKDQASGYDRKGHLQSSLKQRLLGHPAERYARLGLTVFSVALLGFLMPLFIFWFAGCALAVLPAVGILVSIAAVANSMSITTIVGGVLAGVTGIDALAGMRAKQLDYEKKVDAVLNANYKNTGMTKAEKFAELEAELNRKMALIKNNPRLCHEMKHGGYDINKIDVYNDYYFEKQKHSPSTWTWIKKGMNRFYNLLGGGQSGALVARMLFLVGGVAAITLSAFTCGAPIAFIAVAASLAVVLGVARLVKYQFDRNHEHREFFVDTIDARISYLGKKNKELDLVLGIENKEEKRVRNGTSDDNGLWKKNRHRKVVSVVTSRASTFSSRHDASDGKDLLRGHDTVGLKKRAESF